MSCQKIPMAKRAKAAANSFRMIGAGGPPRARSSAQLQQTVSARARTAPSKVRRKAAMTFGGKVELCAIGMARSPLRHIASYRPGLNRTPPRAWVLVRRGDEAASTRARKTADCGGNDQARQP